MLIVTAPLSSHHRVDPVFDGSGTPAKRLFDGRRRFGHHAERIGKLLPGGLDFALACRLRERAPDAPRVRFRCRLRHALALRDPPDELVVRVVRRVWFGPFDELVGQRIGQIEREIVGFAVRDAFAEGSEDR